MLDEQDKIHKKTFCNPGDYIQFNREELEAGVSQYLGTGWNNCEEGYISTEGHCASIVFCCSSTAKILRLRCWGFSPDGESTRVSIRINGDECMAFSLDEKPVVLFCPLPWSEESQFSEYNICVNVINPRKPRDYIEGNNDSQDAGFYLESMELDGMSQEEGKLVECARNLDKLFPGGSIIFWPLLAKNRYLRHIYDCQIGPYLFLLWAWQHGIHEDLELSVRKDFIFNCLKKLNCSILIDKTPLVLPPYIYGALCRRLLDGAAIDFDKVELKNFLPEAGEDNRLMMTMRNQTQITRKILTSISGAKRGAIRRVRKLPDLLSFETLEKNSGFYELKEFKGPNPTLKDPMCQTVTFSQFNEPDYARWHEQFKAPFVCHRKRWEYVYILRSLEAMGAIRKGAAGLGFGCGKEFIPSVLARHGCFIMATDFPEKTYWNDTQQQALSLKDLWKEKIVNWDKFEHLVRFMPLNMNSIPEYLHGMFDFTWSSCALEHLGSISHGLEFIKNSVRCLKPGGIAVHTTELNISDLDDTKESPGLSFFRMKDIEELSASKEFSLMPFNWSIGTMKEDRLVSLSPFRSFPHLKLLNSGHIITSIGIIVRKNFT